MRNDNARSGHPEATSRSVQPSIRTIAEIEKEYLREERSSFERFGDRVGGLVGSFKFIVLQILFIAAWLVMNLHLVPGVVPFDPWPFQLLELVLAVESVFLVAFVLFRENTERRLAEQRAHLNLQVSYLADTKASEILKLLAAVSDNLGLHELAAQEQVRRLSRQTDIETIDEELEILNEK